MRYLLLIILIVVANQIFSQNYTLSISVDEYPSSYIYIADFYGDKNNIIDSALTNDDGKAMFAFKKDAYNGMYRLYFNGSKKFVDFIFNNENIILKTEYYYPMDSMKVISSVENIIYYNFLRADMEFQMKLELLSPLMTYFPRSDSFYEKAKHKYSDTQDKREEYILKIEENYPDAFATSVLLFKRMPKLPATLTENEKYEFVRSHFFDKVEFTNPFLLRSDVYSSKILEYLTMYSNPKFNQSQLEDAFIDAIDVLMSKPFDNKLVKNYVIDFLVKGFERYGFEKVLLHIAETYNDDTECEDEAQKSDLQKRLDAYKRFAVGKIAPDFVVSDQTGKTIISSEIDADYIMLVFWATWCPHCTQMIPQIRDLYNKQEYKKIEVVAFSLDTNDKVWHKFIEDNNLNWINASDFKSWKSKIAVDYSIYATPTILVLNKNMKIVSKPLSMKLIEQEFNKR